MREIQSIRSLDELTDRTMHDIAIVTTFYNDSDVISRLLQSLLKQTCCAFAHYIYDDGSTNCADDLFHDYGEQLIRQGGEFVYLKGKENLGVDLAHQVAFRAVKENYLIWVDADDWVDPRFIEVLRRKIRRHPDVALFHLNSWQYDENLSRHPHTTAFYYSMRSLSCRDQFPYICMNTDEWYAHQCLVKKEALLSINPTLRLYSKRYDGAPYYDAQIFFELAACHLPFRFIKKPLSHIYNRSCSETHKNRNEGNASNPIALHDEFYSKPCFYFGKFPFPSSSVELYSKLIPWRRKSLEILKDINDGHLRIAKQKISEYKVFLKQVQLNQSYFLFRTSIQHALLKQRFGSWIRIMKKVLKR